ncbi:MAG: class I SAM-dependent methyltransferase [Pyrinomonadaceae bacterium]
MAMVNLLFVLLLSLIPLVQQPQQQTGADRPLAEYLKIMEGERRVSELQIGKVIETLGIKPNAKVADIGAGSGLFTRPLAKAVGVNGVVYAAEIRQDLVDCLAQQARERKLGNVRAVLAAEDDPRLPEPVDLIVIIDTLHHIKSQPAYLKNLRRHLTADGRIAVIDFKADYPVNHEHLKYTLSDLEGWMRGAGYVRAESHDFLACNFFVIYRRR